MTYTYHTDLADILRAGGVQVIEEAGWKTRGQHNSSMLDIQGIVCHHDASNRNGPGALDDIRANIKAQLFIGRDCSVHVVAAGLCWHAGVVFESWQSNEHTIGIEVANDGIGEPWSPELYDTYVRVVRALKAGYRVPDNRVAGHKEVASPHGRKSDPDFDMNAFRASVLAGGPGTPVTPGPAPAPAPQPSVPTDRFPFGAGEYFGDKSGPAASHGGGVYAERAAVKNVQQWFIRKGCVPGVSDPNSGWADGIWEAATTSACEAFFAAYRPEQPIHTRIYADDWAVLVDPNAQHVAPPRPQVPGLPGWRLPAGHYYGLLTGPAKSHGGFNAEERPIIKIIQQRLIAKGYVPGITDINSGWADGKFGPETAQAVTRFQHAEMPGTTRFGEVWSDDYARLAR